MTARPSSRAQRARDPLELVSLRQLRYFSAAMRAPSFNEAARECSISQPALSEQIALLEQVLGVPLFDRTGGRAVPTLSGHELERRIAGSLLELQSALREVPERADTISGLVRVGLVQSYGTCWVVPVMRAAQARWPALSVALRRRTAHALEEGVLRGDFERGSLACSGSSTAHFAGDWTTIAREALGEGVWLRTNRVEALAIVTLRCSGSEDHPTLV